MRRGWFALSLLLTGCTGVTAPIASSPTPAPTATETPAPTATPTPSGPLTEIRVGCLGAVFRQACQAAVDSAAPVGGLKVQAAVVDASAEASQLLTDRSVLGVVGPATSAEALKLGPALEAARLAWISPTASHPKVTDSGWHTAHRLSVRDDVEGPADALFLFGPPVYAKHVAVVDNGDLDSLSLADEFAKRAAALGIKIDRLSATSPELQMQRDRPDAVFVATSASCGLQAPNVKVLLGSPCTAAAGEGAYVSEIADQPPQARATAAARIILQAIQSVAVTSGLDLRRADVNAQVGKSGFDAKGDFGAAKLAIYQVIGGVLKPVR